MEATRLRDRLQHKARFSVCIPGLLGYGGVFINDVHSVSWMNAHHILVGLLHRKAWKAAEILLVAGGRLLNELARRPTLRRTKDREVLDSRILPPFVSNPQYRRILFVGCDWYTRHYEKMFPGREFWTIESAPARARYGAEKHVVADLQDLGQHFESASLDLIICNGVIGWGLDEPAAIETAMAACVTCLAPSGVLVLGWNDVPEKTPIVLDAVRALAPLRRPAGSWGSDLLTDTYNRHRFRVLEKAPVPKSA